LIDELTHLVVEEIAGSLNLIDAEFGPATSISLNVAARQAGNLTYMRSLAEALADTGCPHRFMIEVTEDAVISKAQFQTEIVPLLRELGVRVSIDDFGTGFSSLSALADITADEVKIDRSFITDIHKRPRSQSVLRAIESLSASLGMTVVAEGVETFEELAYLQAATSIRYAQGFYFSKPMFVQDFTESHARADLNRGLDPARPARVERHRQGRAHTFGR
jgi:EAL domain-containing protein (putative c-di-GMP-specific phosphodiesterase class I)